MIGSRGLAAAFVASVLACALFAASAVAAGTPGLRFKALPIPIPGYPVTGNILEAGTALEFEFVITGAEPGQPPPPLRMLRLAIPRGFRITARCPAPGAEAVLAGDCAPVAAGPPGEATIVVGPASARTRETATVQPFYQREGGIGLDFSVASPEAADLDTSSPWQSLAGAGGFGPSLDLFWSLVAARAVDAPAIESLRFRFGTAEGPKRPSAAVYYLTEPPHCLKGGFDFSATATFAGATEAADETVTRTYRAPCPKRSVLQTLAPAPEPPPPPPCRSGRRFVIHIARPRVPYRSVSVTLDGHPVPVKPGRTLTATIDLRGLPKGTHIVKITFVTRSGRRLVSTRTYRTCVPIGESG